MQFCLKSMRWRQFELPRGRNQKSYLDDPWHLGTGGTAPSAGCRGTLRSSPCTEMPSGRCCSVRLQMALLWPSVSGSKTETRSLAWQALTCEVCGACWHQLQSLSSGESCDRRCQLGYSGWTDASCKNGSHLPS